MNYSTYVCSPICIFTYVCVVLVWIEEPAFIITGWYQISANDVQVFFNATLPAKFQCKLDKDSPVTCKCTDK